MKRHILPFVFSTTVVLCSCIDEYNTELPDKSTDILVVEGDIYSDSTTTICLTHTIGLNDNLDDQIIPVVTNASVEVKGTDGSCYNATETSMGNYEVSVGHLSPDEQYWLYIKTSEGLCYESTPASPIDAPEFSLWHEQDYSKEHTDAPVDIFIKAERAEDVQYLRWNYEEYYELQTPYTTKYVYSPNLQDIMLLSRRIDHGFGNRIDNSYLAACTDDYRDRRINGLRLVSIANSSPRLCMCYYIRAHQEAISKAEYEYEEARRKQTYEMGGLFTPMPSKLPTNIHCTNGDKDVIGYIGVRGHVATYGMYLRNLHEIFYFEKRKYKIMTPKDVKNGDYSNVELYASGYQILDYNPKEGATWITNWAVDCRVGTWGFTGYYAPDFWNPPVDD